MDDQTLLSQYVATSNAVAFEELTARYSPLVRGVCRRLLGNAHDAEEVTQECFFELSRHAAEVHSSVGGWLHRTATSRSLNAIRSRARRKARERAISFDAEEVSTDAAFAQPELQQVIQGALKELPDDLRLPVMLHYVDGQSQRDVAIRLGVNQSTISRRMKDALSQLRDKLTQAGYAATAPAIMVLMQEHAIAAPPSSAMTEIAKSPAGKVAGGTALINSVKGIAAALLPLLGYLLMDGWIALLTAVCLMIYLYRRRPVWVAEVMSSFGLRDLGRQPTYFLAKWTWKTPPDDWRTQVGVSLVWSALFAAITCVFAFGSRQPPCGTVALGFAVTCACIAHAIRLYHHASLDPSLAFKKSTTGISTTRSIIASLLKSPSDDSSWSWVDVIQLVLIGLAGLATTTPRLLSSESNDVWPAVALCAAISSAMLINGIQLCYQLVARREVLFSLDRPYEAAIAPSTGTLTVMGIGAVIVTVLSICVQWNPAGVRNLSLSLAAIQTLMLGWMIYRIAAFRRMTAPHLVCRIVIALLAGCFVLNSGTCLANWWPLEMRP